MHRELLPLVKEVGKQAFEAAADAFADRSVRGTYVTSNLYGIDFTIEDLKVDHGVGRVYPVPDLGTEALDVKRDGAILKELGARLYILELENGPTTHHEGELYCSAPETQLMDLSHQIKALKAMGFSKTSDLIERIDVPEGFELILVSDGVGQARIVE
jgi:hypothetical protein